MRDLKRALLVAGVVAFSIMAAAVDGALTPALLDGLPRRTVRAKTHASNAVAQYEGVSLGDVVRKLGAPAGEAIRGKKLSTVVVVRAADGYQVVFALPELDPAFSQKVVLLADRRDGAPLSEKEGPYRLIVPDESREARWIRQVTSIELRDVK